MAGRAGVRIVELDGLVAVALRTGDGAEIAIQHRLGRNERFQLRRGRTVARPLPASEEEQLVFNDLSAGGRAILIALQTVVNRREEIARVHVAIAKILEQISVEGVRSGLSHHVDGRPRVGAETRGYGAGFDAELLNRVREREWHVDVGHRVGIVSAVQQIRGAVALSAGDRDAGRAPERLASRVAAIRVYRRAQRDDKLRRLAIVERQLVDLLLLDHARDRRFLGLHQAGIRGYLDFFGHRAHLHADIDLDVVIHHQYDSGLYVVLEAGGFHFEGVRPHGQVRKNIMAAGVGNGVAHRAFVDFRHRHRDVRQRAAAGIGDGSADLRHRDRLAADHRRQAQSQETKPGKKRSKR